MSEGRDGGPAQADGAGASGFVGRIDELRQGLREAKELARAAFDKMEGAERAFEEAVKAAFETPPEALLRCDTPVTEHRKAHRMGRPAKLDADPELAAFVRARIDRLTFTEIERDVAKVFPEARRVRKSAIHAWWKKQSPR